MSTTRDPIYGCELWRGRRSRDGYGRDGSRYAHVVAWEREVGPIPHGMELDHTCRRRACVAIAHLELVTRVENERRKAWRYRARMQRCKAGHALADAIVTPEGGRVCRTCRKEQG